MKKNKLHLTKLFFRVQTTFAILFIAGVSLLPILASRSADAAQITVRKVTLSTAITGASSSYSFSFTTATSGFNLDGIKLIACDTAIGSYPGGTCTAPSGFSFATGSYDNTGESGFTDATHFTIDAAGANDCVATAHPEVLCLKRTSGGPDTAGTKTIRILTVTNPNAAYLSGGKFSFYIGITTYNTNTWTVGGRKDAGTVAASVTNGLTVSAVVSEILQFCVGSTSDNPSGASDDITNLGSCSGVSNSGVNLGTLDPTAINKSPVAVNGGNSDNGLAILRTNATNGSAVAYRAVQDAGSSTHKGALKIQGIDCASVPSSCITSAAAQAAFTAGTQDFGMTIRGVNCEVASAYYTCSYPSGTEHLVPQSGYIGQSAQYGDTNGFKWREDGSTDTIASAASSNTVADEALVLEFAATPSITTTFGTYSTQADFIATPTY